MSDSTLRTGVHRIELVVRELMNVSSGASSEKTLTAA